MKKSLALAVGVAALLSLSSVAQAADEHAAFTADHDACMTMASGSSTEGDAPAAEAVDAAYKKCMTDKGHSAEELAKHAEEGKMEAPAK